MGLPRFNAILLPTLAILIFAAPRLAFARNNEPRTFLEIGVVQSTPDFSSSEANVTNSSSTAKVSFAGGLFYEKPLLSWLKLETGGLMASRKFDLTATVNGTKVGSQNLATMLEVPLLLRLAFGRVLSLGAGPYYALSVGSRPPGTKTTEYGYMGSVRLYLSRKMPMGLFLDARASQTASNAATSPNQTLRFRDYMGFVGIEIPLGASVTKSSD